MNNQEQRDWPDVDDKDLDYIIAQNSDKRIVRTAKSEKKRRQRLEMRSVQNKTRQAEKPSPVEVVGIHLSFRDWFVVVFKAYLALVLVTIIMAVPMILIYSLIARFFLSALF